MISITWSRKLCGWALACFISFVAGAGVVEAGTVLMGNSTSGSPTVSTVEDAAPIEIAVNPHVGEPLGPTISSFQQGVEECLTQGAYSAAFDPVESTSPLRLQITREGPDPEVDRLCVWENSGDVQYLRLEVERNGLVAKIRQFSAIPPTIPPAGIGGWLYFRINSTTAGVNMARIHTAEELNEAIRDEIDQVCATTVTDEDLTTRAYWVIASCVGNSPTTVSMHSTNSLLKVSEIALVSSTDVRTACLGEPSATLCEE